MDVVVADATPLKILIDAAEVLPQLFTNIHIPIEVLTELSSKDAPEIVRSWIQRLPAWINVHRSEEIGAGEAAVNVLDLGERAAILLAESLRADLLLIDEREGATLAERRGLAVTGNARTAGFGGEPRADRFARWVCAAAKDKFSVSAVADRKNLEGRRKTEEITASRPHKTNSRSGSLDAPSIERGHDVSCLY